MKLSSSCLLLTALCLLGPVSSSAASQPEMGASIRQGTPEALPHGIAQVHKRDVPAEITDVADSNTVPIEDLNSAPISTPGKKQPAASYNEGRSAAAGAEPVSSEDDLGADEASKNPFWMAISMILVSEVGDKTFLISALMAMRHKRLTVFTASFASLALMTLLSGIVGHALPTLLSQRLTQFLAAGLFVVFGIKLTKEGLEMSKDLGVEEELAEVEEELEISEMNQTMHNLESQSQSQSQSQFARYSSSLYRGITKTLLSAQRILAAVIDPLWVQIFVMIFLGEWGDRSQIATIAMAASSDYWKVICGAIIGHGVCTFAAVMGGKMLASKISMRTVTLGGALAFFVFAVLYLYEALYSV